MIQLCLWYFNMTFALPNSIYGNLSWLLHSPDHLTKTPLVCSWASSRMGKWFCKECYYIAPWKELFGVRSNGRKSIKANVWWKEKYLESQYQQEILSARMFQREKWTAEEFKHGAEAIQARRIMGSIEDKEHKHGGRRKKNASGG